RMWEIWQAGNKPASFTAAALPSMSTNNAASSPVRQQAVELLQRRSEQTEQGRPIHADVTTAFREAVALHRKGRLAEAEKCYRQILERHPDHFDSLHLLGVVYSQRGKHAEAVRQIDAALKVNPEAASALNNRGLALEKLERPDEALLSYDQAIALEPD